MSSVFVTSSAGFVGHASEVDPEARLVSFDVGGHPAGVQEYFKT